MSVFFVHILWFEFLPVISPYDAWTKPSALCLVEKHSTAGLHPQCFKVVNFLWCIRNVWKLEDGIVELVLSFNYMGIELR